MVSRSESATGSVMETNGSGRSTSTQGCQFRFSKFVEDHDSVGSGSRNWRRFWRSRSKWITRRLPAGNCRERREVCRSGKWVNLVNSPKKSSIDASRRTVLGLHLIDWTGPPRMAAPGSDGLAKCAGSWVDDRPNGLVVPSPDWATLTERPGLNERSHGR